MSINCESSETVRLDSQEGVTQNLNADQLILLADGLCEDSSRPYLDYLFQQMKESDTIKELSEHAMEMIRIMEDARELEAAYRMTNLYAAQFAKMRELAPENLKMGRGR